MNDTGSHNHQSNWWLVIMGRSKRFNFRRLRTASFPKVQNKKGHRENKTLTSPSYV